MANYYVRSAATGAGTGASWANAYTTLATAISGKVAGDTFWVADDHAESAVVTVTLTFSASAAAPFRIIVVNTHVTEPPTGTATTATLTTTSNLNISGYAYIYGLRFSGGAITILAAGTAGMVYFDTCRLISTAANSFTFGPSAATSQILAVLSNTTVKCASASVFLLIGGIRLIWLNTANAIDSAGSTPTVLLTGRNNSCGNVTLSGVDLSLLGSGKSLIDVSSNTPSYPVYSFQNCKLGASVSILSGTIPSQAGPQVFVDNCDSGSVNYRMEHYKYQGSIVHETTKVRSSGASDGTTTISHKFVSLASGPSLFSPLEGPWMSIWNNISGSSKTLTVELCTENVSLFNDDCWLEVEYLGTSGVPQSVISTSRVTDPFATHAALTTSTATWSGFTTPAPQKITATFTPQVKGLIRARICVAKASTTLYVDPLLTVA